MITVEEARERAVKRLRTKQAFWAADRIRPGADADAWRIALHPPTEREMRADERAAEEWAASWRAVTGAEVEWVSRLWKSIGRQDVPTHAGLADPDAVADFVGGSARRAWRTLRGRADFLSERFNESAELADAFKKHAGKILDLSADDFARLGDVVAWIRDNDVTGMRPRQLPIRGVDGKWFGMNRALVTDLSEAVRDGSLNLVDSDPLIRVRVLDATLAPAGIREFAAPLEQLTALRLRPRVVFVFENLESVLALPGWPGAVAVHGSGYAVDVLGKIPWVVDHPVVYWGDLDSHGFAILNRLRSHHPNVTTVLMDVATLANHRDLWVTETTPHRGSFISLAASETETLGLLRAEGDVRLEQERIPWATALAALREAV